MPNSIQDAKQAIRRQVRAALKAIPAADAAASSNRACTLLQEQRAWKDAGTILSFAPLPGELDVWPLVAAGLHAGKIVALPRFVAATNRYVACQLLNPGTDLTIGRFGIREPAEMCREIQLKPLDLILVPGLAFDLHGRRLGRGKGFYDQLLAGVRGKTCGVAFDQQIVPEVPVEPHDRLVNCILTPTRWIEL